MISYLHHTNATVVFT